MEGSVNAEQIIIKKFGDYADLDTGEYVVWQSSETSDGYCGDYNYHISIEDMFLSKDRNKWEITTRDTISSSHFDDTHFSIDIKGLGLEVLESTDGLIAFSITGNYNIRAFLIAVIHTLKQANGRLTTRLEKDKGAKA